jgi:uncharacterized coiled-coil protein SlyX
MLEITLSKRLVELEVKVNKFDDRINELAAIVNKIHKDINGTNKRIDNLVNDQIEELEKPKLNLRVDSFWTLRDGTTAYIYYEYQEIFRGVRINSLDAFSWDLSGKYLTDKESLYDIIEEWKG